MAFILRLFTGESAQTAMQQPPLGTTPEANAAGSLPVSMVDLSSLMNDVSNIKEKCKQLEAKNIELENKAKELEEKNKVLEDKVKGLWQANESSIKEGADCLRLEKEQQEIDKYARAKIREINKEIDELYKKRRITSGSVSDIDPNKTYKIFIYCSSKLCFKGVKKAVCEAIGCQIGKKYDNCTFTFKGKGTWRPREGANPTSGLIGKVETAKCKILTFCCLGSEIEKALLAARDVHDDEEMGFDIFSVLVPPKGLQEKLNERQRKKYEEEILGQGDEFWKGPSPGDHVMIDGGIIGRIVGLQGKRALVQLNEGMEISVYLSAKRNIKLMPKEEDA